MKRYLLICLFVAGAWPVDAQEHSPKEPVAIVQANGDTAYYAPVRARTRTIVKHEVKHDTVPVAVHDTVRIERTTATPFGDVHVTLAIPRDAFLPFAPQMIAVGHDSVKTLTEPRSQFGFFGVTTYRFNYIGPAYSFRLGPVRFFITAGMSYLSDYERRQTAANAGVAAWGGF